MKLLLLVVLGLGALVVLMMLIGSWVPRGHVASVSARFRQPPERVWATLTDFPRFPEWAPEIVRVERLPDRNGHPVWLHAGRRWSAPMEVVDAAAPRRLEMRIDDPRLPFGGSWTYQIAPADGGSEVIVTERGTIGPPLFRFLARFVFGYTASMRDMLRALGRRLGEDVAPRAVETA